MKIYTLALFLSAIVGVAVCSYTLSDAEKSAIPCIARFAGVPSKLDGAAASQFYKMLAKLVSSSTFKPPNVDPESVRLYWLAAIKKHKEAAGADVSLLAKTLGEKTKTSVECKDFGGGFTKLIVKAGETTVEKTPRDFGECFGVAESIRGYVNFLTRESLPDSERGACVRTLLERLCGKGEVVGWEELVIAVVPTKSACVKPTVSLSKVPLDPLRDLPTLFE